MANDMEEEAAVKAYRFAEGRFLAGDLTGALRSARNARRLFPSLPALQNAVAAYEVHAAAAAAGGAWGGRNWYAVLGLSTDAAVTHEDIRKQYRRRCLVLHPDKSQSAAADGAFQLLQQAWEALSARHPPPGSASTKRCRAQPWPTHAPPSWARTGGSRPPPPDWSSSGFAPPREWSTFGFTPQPDWSEPDGSTFDFKAWRAAYARAKGTIYCGHCDSESAAAAASHGKSGERCHSCGGRFSPPRGSRRPPPPGTGAEPPPPPGKDRQRDDGGESEFTCPTACPRCGTRLSSPVSVGLCNLRCHACSYDATVHVRSRDTATAF